MPFANCSVFFRKRTIRRAVRLLSLVAPPGEIHCGKRQFVFSTMASIFFFYHGIPVPGFTSSRAETLTTVCVNRTRTDLDTDGLHSGGGDSSVVRAPDS